MSIMPLDQLTLESMLRNLPGIQKNRAKAKRSRETQDYFEQMSQRPGKGNYVPTQRGGLFDTVAKYQTDYGQIGNQILGGLGSEYFGRKADRDELDATNQTNDQILRTVDQLRAARSEDPTYSGATEESLRGYLGLLGGPDASSILGTNLRVQSRYTDIDGNVILVMSDGSERNTGRKADFSSRVITAPGQEPVMVGTSGAGRSQVTDLQYPGQDYAPPVGAAPSPAQPPPAASNMGAPSFNGAPGPNAPLEHRIAYAESRGEQSAVSPAGARGVMQLMPKTARYLEQSLGLPPGSTDTDSDANFAAGSKYINDRLEVRNGDERLALMDYNWGQGNVNKWLQAGGDPNKVPKETRDYVDRVGQGRLPGDPNLAGIESANQSVGVLAPQPGSRSMRQPTAYEVAADGQQAREDVGAATAPQRAGAEAYVKGQVLDAEALAGARKLLPSMEANAKRANQAIDEIAVHPGLDYIVGRFGGMIPDDGTPALVLNALLADTPGAGAFALHNQIKGTVFLQGFETLKGGGQITQIEGVKAEQAMARTNRAQTKEDYIAGLRDFQDAINEGVAKMRAAIASGRLNPDVLPPEYQQPGQAPAGAGAESIEDILRRLGVN